MQELATPDGLAGDDAISPAEYNEDEALSAVYDKLTEEPVEDAPLDEAPDQPDDQAQIDEPAAEAPAPPSFLPGPVKEKWASLDPDVRDAIAHSQGEMSRKLADVTRQNHGIAPIRDELTSMAKEFPQLLNMRPEQVIGEMRQLAQIGQKLEQNPVQAILEVARQRGIEQQLAQVFSGQKPTEGQNHITQLQAEIRSLKQQLSQVGNPEYLQEQVSTLMQQQSAMGEVQNFAQKAEHWDKVENILPKIIPFVRETKPGASATDILAASYDVAIQQLGLKAQAKAGDEPAPTDPRKAEAAMKAKSVNVQGARTGKPRALSEDEMLAQVYDRAIKG